MERLNFTPIVAGRGRRRRLDQEGTTENRAVLKAIITDMHMPHMDGLAFVRALRQTHPDLPVVMASGRVDESVAQVL